MLKYTDLQRETSNIFQIMQAFVFFPQSGYITPLTSAAGCDFNLC
jgi:hypothetical protein